MSMPVARALWCGTLVLTLLGGCGRHHPFAVTTYHYDNLRTGWNAHEHRLTPDKVASPHFGPLYAPVGLDDQVDAQPLYVPGENITGGARPGKYDVVYVATERNTVYAIDAGSGNVLLQRTLDPAVPLAVWPKPFPAPPAWGCGNNSSYVGINGTPVIDRAANTMYVLTYVFQAGATLYRLHALNLGDLTDRAAVPVSASQKLTDGSTFNFNAGWQRQRPGLIENGGRIYAAFGSFCDWGGEQSRGWLLGWQTPGLGALLASQLNNKLPAGTPPAGMFLSSVWMSGYGVAGDASGNLFFVTGNSDSNLAGGATPYYTTYDGPTTYHNIQNSVVSLPPDLTGVRDVFTPWAENNLDQWDADFGSGGVMLLPDRHGPLPHLAAAAGKDGILYLLDRDHLGGYNAPSDGGGATDSVLAIANIGACWCGPAYFEREDARYIVTSGGSSINVWRVRSAPSVALIHEGTSPPVTGAGGGGQDSGFLTSVSSDGARDTIIWAISRPDAAGNLWLYAFEALPPHGTGTLKQLYAQPVGIWGGGNANPVPVVADGKVFVATYQQLMILGLK